MNIIMIIIGTQLVCLIAALTMFSISRAHKDYDEAVKYLILTLITADNLILLWMIK